MAGKPKPKSTKLSARQKYKLAKRQLKNQSKAINSKKANIAAIGHAVAESVVPTTASFAANSAYTKTTQNKVHSNYINDLIKGGAQISETENEEEKNEFIPR